MKPSLIKSMLYLVCSASKPLGRCGAASPSLNRAFHAGRILLQDGASPEEEGDDGDESGTRGRNYRVEDRGPMIPQEERRVGRPFLDPRAPRRNDRIRQDPMHADYKGMVDILEHAAYCDGQREEAPEGFFFDNTRPAYDSDCDGDPFAASYLSEDEYEFPEEYSPAPYIPGRVMDAMWYLYTAKRWPIARIASKYSLQTVRVSAILNLKATEPHMKATGRYDERIDAQLEDLYAGRFGTSKDKTLPNAGGRGVVSKAEGMDGYDQTLDLGVKYQLLQDEQDPDVAMPRKRAPDGGFYGGHELRIAHGLPNKAAPAKGSKGRVHDSKFIFRDISSATRKTPESRRANPLLTSDWDGSVRLSSNMETLSRSWEPRRWSVRAVKGKVTTYPFPDEDADKPAKFRLKP